MDLNLGPTPATADGTSIVVLGAGGTGLLIADSVVRCGQPFAGFLDDDPDKKRKGQAGYAVVGDLASWSRLPENHMFLSSLYAPKRTPFFMDLVASLEIPDGRWATVIDPAAVVSPLADLAPGVYVGPGCIVEAQVRLGLRSALLGNCYVAHDSQLCDYAVCANSVAIAGRVVVGRAAYVGANASIRGDTMIGARAVVGLGAVVLNDVPEGGTVVGNPAQPIGAARGQKR